MARAEQNAHDDAAFGRWLRAAGTADAGAFTPSKEIFAAWRMFAGDDAGSLGWFAGQMRDAGVAPHRTNRAKGFRFRLVAVDEVKAAIDAANLARKKAQKARDAGALAKAVRELLSARRRAGAMLEAGMSSPSGFGIDESRARRYRAWAQLDDADFASTKVETAARRAVAGLAVPAAGPRMVVSSWFVDELGIKSRTVTAAEEPQTKDRAMK